MALSKETVKKLRTVKEAILAQPQFYNQNAWVRDISSCGTTCCIAGWVDFLFNGKSAHEARAKRLNLTNPWGGTEEWIGIVRDVIGLSPLQTEILTDPAFRWPEPFCNGYDDAKSPKQRAKVAAARIEHFIATDGAE